MSDMKLMSELRDRRLLWPPKHQTLDNIFTFPLDYGLRNRVLDWAMLRTGGKFFIGTSYLYFEDNNDAMMFRLSDFVTRDGGNDNASIRHQKPHR